MCLDDSGFKQGFEAAKLAYLILEKNRNPANMPSFAPTKGLSLVNRERAKMLGLERILSKNHLIDKYIEKALALKK